MAKLGENSLVIVSKFAIKSLPNIYVFSPQVISVYPPNTKELFLIIVTVCGFPSQRLWKVLAAQPWEEAR